MKRTPQTHTGNVTGSDHNKRARYSQTPTASAPMYRQLIRTAKLNGRRRMSRR